MSTLQNILGTDKIKDSRAVINSNFNELNNDKVEDLADLGLTKTAAQYNTAVDNAPTNGEKAALAGTGTPGVSNPYVTKDTFDAAGAPNIVVFTSSGTYTKPAGLKSVIVEVVGGGGGGGGAVNSSSAVGNKSSGGGGYSKKRILASALGTTETVTVGAGGTPDNTGGTTSFGSHCSATGGEGGSTNVPIGGIGIGGNINVAGSPSPGNRSSDNSGLSGGSSVLGGGGRGATSWDVQAGNGRAYGGGGGGGGGRNGPVTLAGGSGAPGVCIVTEFY